MELSADTGAIRKSIEIISNVTFSVGVYRPPSEGGSASLLLRITENCPWNKCTFCEMYKGQAFVYRSVEDIKADIDTVKAISDELTAVSWKMGQGGRITREVGMAVLRARSFS